MVLELVSLCLFVVDKVFGLGGDPLADLNKIFEGARFIIEGLGLGNDQHTEKTAERMAKALIELCYYHLYSDKEPDVAVFEDQNYDELVVVKDIPFTSICSHHLLIFEGVVHVVYLPNGKIIGLSKIPRIVEYFARRPQVQEYLVRDIADYIMDKIQPHGVMVVAEGRHSCAACRGIQKEHTFTTSAVRGIFREDRSIREEAYSLIYGKNSK